MLVEEFNSKVIYLNKNVATEITKKKNQSGHDSSINTECCVSNWSQFCGSFFLSS